MESKENPFLLKIPRSSTLQIRELPDFDHRVLLCRELYDEVLSVFETKGVRPMSSSYRAKTDESIRKYLDIRSRLRGYRSERPIFDIYGIRVIIRGEEEIANAIQTILDHFNPPAKYFGSIDSVVDYRNPRIRPFPFSDERYKAVHIRIPFGNNGVKNLGEIQLMTPEWYEMNKKTEIDYQQNKDSLVPSRGIEPPSKP